MVQKPIQDVKEAWESIGRLTGQRGYALKGSRVLEEPVGDKERRVGQA